MESNLSENLKQKIHTQHTHTHQLKGSKSLPMRTPCTCQGPNMIYVCITKCIPSIDVVSVVR